MEPWTLKPTHLQLRQVLHEAVLAERQLAHTPHPGHASRGRPVPTILRVAAATATALPVPTWWGGGVLECMQTLEAVRLGVQLRAFGGDQAPLHTRLEGVAAGAEAELLVAEVDADGCQGAVHQALKTLRRGGAGMKQYGNWPAQA